MNCTDAEKRELIEKNMALIKYIISRYKTNSMFEYNDLLHEGVLGFYKAIDEFDPAKEKKLTSYAGFWIRYYAANYIKKLGFTVHLPENVIRKCRKEQKEGNDVAFKQYAKANELKLMTSMTRHLDHNSPDNTLLDDERYNIVVQAVDKLPPALNNVIRMRYGFNNGKRYQVVEIARLMGMSTNAIHQKERAALKKLRSLINSQEVL